MFIPLIVLAVLALVAVFALAAMYNGLITLRNRYKNAFAQIDVQLKRRYDLIPNLVETAKGYLKHERETLEHVIAARNAAVADRGDPGRSLHIVRHAVRHRAHSTERLRVATGIDRDDADGLLPPMLQRIEAEVDEIRRIRPPEDAKNTALFVELVEHG